MTASGRPESLQNQDWRLVSKTRLLFKAYDAYVLRGLWHFRSSTLYFFSAGKAEDLIKEGV